MTPHPTHPAGSDERPRLSRAATLAVLRDAKNPRAWTVNSLRPRAAYFRAQARRCHKAFATHPYMDASHHLANIYDEAADLFEREIAALEVPHV